MATLDWHVTTQKGITLVRLLVTSEATERVRVTNRLEGPVWPPRREGVPENGWDEDGFEGVIGAEDRLVLGYACPAEPRDPPARVTSLGSDEDITDVTPREVVRSLGDPSPPRDAIAGSRADTFDGETPSQSAHRGPDGGSDRRLEKHDTDARQSDRYGREETETGGNWEAVQAWLDEIADRTEDAERLAGVSSVPEATAALSAVGDTDDVAALVERLETDRRRAGRVSRRCETLADRLDDVEVPAETLARLT